ncbi:hypothetical protein [Longimicrobium sp.]|uniref:hypothetical protein n=1 Tax=Longimicrobium sp. TaxID=2029185 RepID=UPI003B3AADF0
MRRRAAVLGTGALLLLGVGALSAFRAGARADRELSSPLFTAPVALRPDVDRLLPARTSGDARAIGTGQRVLRIDGDAGDAEAGFGSVADVAPSLSGDTVYVLDGMSLSVSAFAANGRFLFSFGGKGKGPGEFRRPVQLLVLPWSGEVAVWDVDTQRLTVHTPAGAVARVLAPGAADPRGKVRRIRAFGGGYVMEVHSDPLQVSRAEQGGALVRLDTAARSPRALFGFAIPAIHASHVEPAPGTSVTHWSHPPAWSPEARWEVLADGTVLFAPGGPDEAYRIATSGRTMRLRREHGYARVTRKDRLRHLEGERDRHLIASPTTPVAVLEPLNRRFYASVRPAVTGLLAGPGGSLWTRGFDMRDSWRGFSRTWNRTHADGTPSDDVLLPAGFEPLHIIDGLAYGIAEGEMYVQRVEAYRVEEGR